MKNDMRGKQKKQKKELIIILVSVFSVLLMILLCVLLISGKGKKNGRERGFFTTTGTEETDTDNTTESTESTQSTGTAEDTDIDAFEFHPDEIPESDPYLTDNSIEEDAATKAVYANDILVVCFSGDISVDEKKTIMKKYGLSVAGQNDMVDEVYLRVEKGNLSSLKTLSSEIEKEKGVELCEPEYFFETVDDEYTPTDPWSDSGKKEEWDETEPAGNNWYMEAIEARGAWEYKDELARIMVGVLDDGMYQEHEDLKGRVVCLTEPEIKGNESPGVTCHATHVTGIIAANENEFGMCGVAGNSDILYLSFSSEIRDEALGDAVSGVNNSNTAMGNRVCYLVTNGAKIINCSFGFRGPETDSKGDIEKRRIDYDGISKRISRQLAKLRERGYDFLIVQSAGNGANNGKGIDACYNGYFSSVTRENCFEGTLGKDDILDRIIIVGASECTRKNEGTGSYYEMTEWSNAGTAVDICAPGQRIWSTVYGDKKYQNKDGTSMSAPIVSGVCSLVWGADPGLSGAEVKKIVCDSKNSIYKVRDNKTSANTQGEYCMVNAKLSVEEALRRVDPDRFRGADNKERYRKLMELIYEYSELEETAYGGSEESGKAYERLTELREECERQNITIWNGGLSSDGDSYEFRDITGDGMDELLIFRDNDFINAIYSEENGAYKTIFAIPYPGMGMVEQNSGDFHIYDDGGADLLCKVKNDRMQTHVAYNTTPDYEIDDTAEFYKTTYDENGEKLETIQISREEYIRETEKINQDMKEQNGIPLSEFF